MQEPYSVTLTPPMDTLSREALSAVKFTAAPLLPASTHGMRKEILAFETQASLATPTIEAESARPAAYWLASDKSP
ncbi:hypothetical protein AUJ14_01735 [Candidatus Micrarchaeota archaeon CG1_02_55_22]|nr:MAG: hypothetical protein AUJ14_01735 [Candidatus Micrarchaeota archaeon CG1_02_55_22]